MATITSTQTGDWDATATWAGGSVPSADDLVVIAHGHRVTLDTDITGTRTGDVTIDGNLHFANGGKMHLNGRMTVKNTSNVNNTAGEFVTDSTSSGSLLSMVGGSEIKISGDNSAQHGIQVDARAWCGVQIDGSEPTLKTELNGNHDYRSTYLTVDNSANFAAGDLISIYKREEDFRLANDECFYVHDVDTDNHRVYFRQFVCPKTIVRGVSGTNINVDDATVFRVGYQLIFGTGNNRNVLTITAINKNTITFGSTVDNDPSLIGEAIYQTGTEKYHLSDSHVRRTSSCMTNTYSGATDLRTVNVNNAADFSVGDKIYIEACGENSRVYVSGSETNAWRHRLVYTITAINSLTLTVDRDILYDGEAGGLISKLTRDVVIKACDSSGNNVAYADQDTARVFFNVKYWTSTGWNAAPTRRVKIKYVEFDGLGYNTADSTNFRQGVCIAGYNGRYDTKVTGSAADNSTIHSNGGVSQTGENYIDGCSYTAYNLCSNTSRDGDTYPSVCIRNPYGMVARNMLIVGAGRGIWHWSSQYHLKTHGHIVAACVERNCELGSAYEQINEFSYMYFRMCQNYGFSFSHTGRQNDLTTMQHLDIRYQNQYAIYPQYASNATMRRWKMDKYRYLMYNTDSTGGSGYVWLDSEFLPNAWDATPFVWGITPATSFQDDFRFYRSGNNQPYRGTASNLGKHYFLGHGFKENEYAEFGGGIMKINRDGSQVADYFLGTEPGQIMSRIHVPANTVVKIRSRVKVNSERFNGESDTVDNNSYPVIIARPKRNSGFFGKHANGVISDAHSDHSTFYSAVDIIENSNDIVGFKNSTENKGKLQHGFVEYATHTSASQGAWETKDITVAAQHGDYELAYGYYIDNSDIRDVGWKAMPIDVIMSKRGVLGSTELRQGNLGRVSVKSDFGANKKRISGRI